MLLILFLSCGYKIDSGCLHRDLSEWCFHDEGEEGPINPDGLSCDPPVFEADASSYRCGDVDVAVAEDGGFTGAEQYFDHESGDLIAVGYWTDVNHYCGGFTYWYGERMLDCTPECSYDPASTDLPICD